MNSRTQEASKQLLYHSLVSRDLKDGLARQISEIATIATKNEVKQI